MGSRALLTIFLALLVCGCVKRQTPPAVIYVQAPPPEASSASAQATNSASDGAEALAVEEPPPIPVPAPEITTLPLSFPPPPAPKPRTRPRTESHNEETPLPVESDQPVTTAGPQLQSRSEGSSKDANQLQSRLKELRGEVTGYDRRSDLSAAERRTLQDAGAFLSESEQAFAHNDLLRATQLADKASQLLAALTQRR